jgi:hypothetical protein
MKPFLILTTYFFLCAETDLLAQKNFSTELPDGTFIEINSPTADSLIQVGKFYQLSFGSHDFRIAQCRDSLSSKYGFTEVLIYKGCIPILISTHDSIHVFNSRMSKALEKTNGKEWEKNYQKDIDHCVQSMCPVKEDISKYLFLGWGEPAYLYKPGQTKLDGVQKCIVDHMLLKMLKENPKVRIKITANTISSEENASKTLCKMRGENFRDYLAAKGIDKSRLEISWQCSDEPFKVNSLEWNRRVDVEVLEMSEEESK